MKRLVLFSAVLGASTALASAADIYSPAPYEPPPATPQASSFNWTGVFAGIHGGFGGNRFDYPWILDIIDGDDPPVYFDGQFDITSSGFFGGGQVGANWQFAPQWVAGVVGDIAWSGIKGELGLDVGVTEEGSGTFPLFEGQAGSKINWFGTLRGRLGFVPAERLMIYATGGAAVGETESYANGCLFGSLCDGVSTSGTNWGWAAGGGFEVAVTNNITFGAEYLYVDLGSQTLIAGDTGGDIDSSLDVDTEFHTVKATMNFLFGNNGGAGADLPYYTPVETTSEPFKWTGFFAGIHGGFGGDHFDYPWILDLEDGDDPPEYLDGQFDITSSGFFGGGQVGANWQFAPQWVAGVVGDIAWSDIKGELGLNIGITEEGSGTFTLLEGQAGSKVNWFGTLRGRLGFLPTERFMVYATGGAAVGETESYVNGCLFESLCDGVSASDTNWGWTAGGGFEFAVTNNVTFGAEYLYVDLGSQTLISDNTGGDIDSSLGVDTHFHTLKATMNFLLN